MRERVRHRLDDLVAVSLGIGDSHQSSAMHRSEQNANRQHHTEQNRHRQQKSITQTDSSRNNELIWDRKGKLKAQT